MSFGELPNRRKQIRKEHRRVTYNAKAKALRRAFNGIVGKREPWTRVP